MTRANLIALAEKFQVFKPEQTSQMSSSEKVQKIRDWATVEYISAGARRGESTIAFTVSFDHRRPNTAARVANELVTLFMDENVRRRTAMATETTEFLQQEADKLERELIEIEDKIAEYKQEHSEALPENLELRIGQRERLERQIRELEREIKGQQEELRFLDVQLRAAQSDAAAQDRQPAAQSQNEGLLPPGMAPLEELRGLWSKLAEARAVYSEAHPDVKALKRQIEAEEQRILSQGGAGAVVLRIERTRDELQSLDGDATARREELQQKLAALEDELQQYIDQPAPQQPSNGNRFAEMNVENIRTKIAVAEDRIASLRQQKEELQAQLEQTEEAILQTPQVDRALRGLQRDYQNTRKKYQEIRDKAMEAQIAENVEEASKSERFVLVEPPTVPDEPVQPNRKQLLALGFAVSFAAGMASLVGVEFIDGSIRGPENLAALTNMAPLAVLPYITTRRERRMRKLKVFAVFLLGVTALAGALAAIHFYYMPLETVMYKVLDRLN